MSRLDLNISGMSSQRVKVFIFFIGPGAAS